jgi:hypothetical protein
MRYLENINLVECEKWLLVWIVEMALLVSRGDLCDRSIEGTIIYF